MDNVQLIEHQSGEESGNEINAETEGERYDRRRGEREERAERGDRQAGELREEIFAYFDLKFDQQKQENEELRRQLKKQENKETKFTQKGHEIQFKFNLSIEEKIDDLEAIIQRSRSARNIKAQVNILASMRDMIKKRNKLIKIADRSELGWKTVKEYESDDIADDSADEKRLKAAEKAAAAKDKQEKAQKESKLKAQQKGNNSVRSHPYSSSTTTRRVSERRSSPQRQAETTTSISVRDNDAAFNRGSHNSHGSTSRVRSAYTTHSTSAPNPSASRPCFQCGDATHWRQDCPYRT